MRQIPSLAAFALFALFAAIAACSSSEGPGEGQDAGTSADAALAPDAGAARDAGGSADAGAPKDAGSGPDASGPVVITGSVKSLTASQAEPLSGAKVEIVGANPAITTTTGTDGTYSLTVAPGTYFVRASKQGMVSTQVGVVTSTSTAVTELGLLSTLATGLIAGQLRISLDPAKGIVVVGFDTSDTGGGYSATLSAQPGSSFALPSSGWPPEQRNTTLPGGQSANALFFLNVPPGTTTVSFGAPNNHSCREQLPIGTYRVDANVATAIGATCQ